MGCLTRSCGACSRPSHPLKCILDSALHTYTPRRTSYTQSKLANTHHLALHTKSNTLRHAHERRPFNWDTGHASLPPNCNFFVVVPSPISHDTTYSLCSLRWRGVNYPPLDPSPARFADSTRTFGVAVVVQRQEHRKQMLSVDSPVMPSVIRFLAAPVVAALVLLCRNKGRFVSFLGVRRTRNTTANSLYTRHTKSGP
jgi:hypothetical protein